jgi:hypothetical protein
MATESDVTPAPREASVEELTAEEAQELGEDHDTTYGWKEVCAATSGDDVRRMLFLDLFQDMFAVSTSVDALVHAPEFLDSFLMDTFDYRAFIEATGLAEEDMSQEDFVTYEKHNLQEDVTVAVSTIVELVTLIASRMGLPLSEAFGSMPGGSAVRVLPKCVALSRWMPGALCTARAIKCGVPTMYEGASPFESEEAAGAFDDHFGTVWEECAIAMTQDAEVASCCSALMRCGFVNSTEFVTIVSFVPVNIYPNAPNASFKQTEFTDDGPDVLVEVEPDIGRLFEEGMLVDAHWYELSNAPWFLGSIASVRSGLRDADSEGDLEDAPGEEDEPGEETAALEGDDLISTAAPSVDIDL